MTSPHRGDDRPERLTCLVQRCPCMERDDTIDPALFPSEDQVASVHPPAYRTQEELPSSIAPRVGAERVPLTSIFEKRISEAHLAMVLGLERGEVFPHISGIDLQVQESRRTVAGKWLAFVRRARGDPPDGRVLVTAEIPSGRVGGPRNAGWADTAQPVVFLARLLCDLRYLRPAKRRGIIGSRTGREENQGDDQRRSQECS